ncbi:major facilitator superfamily domain-containing protein [Aspergillus egyptiacus]|nr:major facilitator superfamily domain-containing protein [Aspergillus egyptiacus]
MASTERHGSASPESNPARETTPLNRGAGLDAASAYKLNANVLNRAIQGVGMGRYQWQLFGVVGFGWACDNLWPIVTSLILVPVTYEFRVSQPPFLLLAQNIGLLVGALFWGFGCDLFGRRLAFNMTIGITAVFSLFAAWSPTFAAVCTLASLWSIGVGGNLPVDSAIFLEFLPGSHQYLLTVLSVNWALAQLLANLVAWPLIGNFTCPSAEECTRSGNLGWRIFLGTMGGLALAMCITRYFFFTLLESPKYLMGKGQHYQAVAVVHEVARRNGKSCNLTVDELHDCTNDEEVHEERDHHHQRGLRFIDQVKLRLEPLGLARLHSLFSTKRRAWTTTLMIGIWALIGLAFPLYNAFLPYLQNQRGIEFGDGSTYLTYRNSLIIAGAGVPGSLVGGVMVEMPQLGRKGTLALSTILTGVFLLCSTTATTSSALLGWNCAYGFSSSLVYAVLYAYTPEMFETRNRGTGNALVSAANRLSGILAPLVALGSDLQATVPVYLSGVIFLLAGVLAMLVPYETRGQTSVYCQMPALYLEACPTMAFAYDHEADFWGVLINPDKSPSPLLEQLCLGIAQLMTTFDNYTISDLTPERLATFYRKVGGNYDILFLETKPSALSFIYQRLGCFHSIQPSADPYRPPSIPALQPHGFVRWQTIQLLLDPDEHVAYLQNAVERWNIFSPTGAVFPKSIPREAFPAEPDPEMVLWHQTVSQKFEFDYWRKNLVRSSPPNFGSYHDQFQKGSPTSTKKDEFAQSYHPRASNYRASVPADPQLSRRHHQRRRSAEVPPRSSHKKSQSSLPRRSAEFVGAYVSPRAPTPPSAVKQQTKSRGRERKPYPRPTGPKPAHGHSSSDASSEDSVTPRQEPASTPSRSARRHLSPAHPPHARRHSHEAYSRRPRRDLSPDSQKRYAYRDALHAKTGRVYDSDSGRGVRKQPGDYIDEVRQSRTPGPQLQDPVYRESTTVPTSPAHGPIHSVHPIHPVHPRFVNVSDPSYLMHPQADLDANVVEDPRRTACRNGSLTPTPSGSNPYGRPRFASVGGFQPARWSSMHGSGGRPVPPGITEVERGRRSSMYDR